MNTSLISLSLSLIPTLVHIDNLDTIEKQVVNVNIFEVAYLAITLHHEICLGVAAVEDYSFRLPQTASAATLAAEGVIPEEQDGEHDAGDIRGNPIKENPNPNPNPDRYSDKTNCRDNDVNYGIKFAERYSRILWSTACLQFRHTEKCN